MSAKLYIGLLVIFLSFAFSQKQNNKIMDFEKNRINMLAEQITSRGISDSDVIKAMKKVERHLFVPLNLQAYAYKDRPLPIGYNQTISQPYIVGLMSQLLNTNKDEKILEIGTGSGYQAAILGELCGQVYSIEIIEPLQKRAAYILDSIGYKNVHTKCGDGYLGWPTQAPFDAIIVTCSPSRIPEPLIEQLAEGGRMVIPVGLKSVKKLVLLKKKNGEISKQSVISVRFVPMVDEKGNSY
nr:protein-L-isoaspartate(D-aspartate) O-methyltransferase [uncultured Marinifilum sp.]